MLPSNAGKIDKLFLLPPATISSVPIYDFADTHMGWQLYIIHVAERVFVEDVSTHLGKTGNNEKCPFCNAQTQR